jgi:hypothetical protein
MRRKYFLNTKNLLLIFSGVFGIVTIWRGIWGLMDLYLFPDQPQISYILSIVIGVIVLLLDDADLRELGSHRSIQAPEKNS